jgi:hypothetical protein
VKYPLTKTQVNNVAVIVESCRKLISDIATPLEKDDLPAPLREAIELLSKAHVALLEAETLFKS